MTTLSSTSNSLVPVAKHFDVISETGSIVSTEGPNDVSHIFDLAIRMDAHVLPSILDLGNDVPIVEPIAVAVLIFYESYDLMQSHKDTLDKRKSILSQGTHLVDHVMQKVSYANIGQFTSAKLVCYNATYSEHEEMRPATPGSPYLAGKELETAIIDVQNAPSNFEPPPQPTMPSLAMEWEFDELKSRVTHAAMMVCDAGYVLFDAKWSSFTKTKKYSRINACIDRIQKCAWECINVVREVDQRIIKSMDDNKVPHKFVEKTRYSVTRRFTLSSEEKSKIAECSEQLNFAVIEFVRAITKWNSLFFVSEREKDSNLLQIKTLLHATTFDALVKQHLKVYKYRKDWLHNEVIQWLETSPSGGNQNSSPSGSFNNKIGIAIDGKSSDYDNSGAINHSSNNNSSRIFWYRAGEGRGKSVFTAALVDRLNRYYTSQLLGVVFFKFNDTPQSRPAVVLKSLMYQLVRGIPDLTELVLQRLEGKTEEQLDSVKLLQDLFIESLCKLSELRVAIGASGNMIILIDGLDEAFTERSEDRCHFIVWFTGFITALPSWLKLFITSRQSPDLMTALSQFVSNRRYSIDESDPRNERDVKFYLNHIVVQSIPAAPTPELGFIASNEATELLLKKSEGSFVYTSILPEQLTSLLRDKEQGQQLTLEQYQEKLSELPDGVSMAFMQMFNQIFKSAPLVKSMELLQVLVFVQEPLTKAELENFLLMESMYSEDFSKLIAHFSELFPLRDSVDGGVHQKFNASHRALCDWLTNAAQSGPYYCNPAKGHHLIVKRLLQKINVECRLNEGCAILQDLVELRRRLSEYLSLSDENRPLKSYLFKYLLTHLDCCMDSDPKLRFLSYYLLTSTAWIQFTLPQIGSEALWREYDRRMKDERWLSECVECREDIQGVERRLYRIIMNSNDGKLIIDNDDGNAVSSGTSSSSSEVVVRVAEGNSKGQAAWVNSVCAQVTEALDEVKEIRRMNQVTEAPDKEEEGDY